MPLVSVVMGSRSDEAVCRETQNVLEELGVDYEVRVMSADRTPDKVREYALEAPSRGIEVFIAAAGGAAALPGVLASWSTLPVIGVPLSSSDLKGLDALMAVAQMPPGVPVACMAVGSWGARNAAFFAAQILALKYDNIRESYERHKQRLREQ